MWQKLACFMIWWVSVSGQFEVPDARVEVFHPKGLKVSIPDKPGIKLFAFHGKVNEPLEGLEGGTFSRDVLKAKEGRWTFYDPLAQLKIGDTLYYWTYADYFDGQRKLGYQNLDQEFKITELLDRKTGRPVSQIAPPAGDGHSDNPNRAKGDEDENKNRPNPAGFGAECGSSATKSNGKEQCAGREIFSEDFSQLSNTFWSPEIKFAGSPDFEFVVYENRRDILYTNKEGSLIIKPVLTDRIRGEGFVTNPESQLNYANRCTGVLGTQECEQKPQAYLIIPPVTSAQITTKNRFSFRYGKVIIRAKLPKGDWMYPELYLSPLTEEYGPGLESGQIRIAFLAGNEGLSKSLFGGCVLGPSTPARHYAMKKIVSKSKSWADEYHNFTLSWYPDHISIAVDETVYGSIYPPSGGFSTEAQNLDLKNAERLQGGGVFAPFDKEMYLTIGVGVGGHCFDDSIPGKPWKNNEPKAQKNFYRAKNDWSETWKDESALKVDFIKVTAL